MKKHALEQRERNYDSREIRAFDDRKHAQEMARARHDKVQYGMTQQGKGRYGRVKSGKESTLLKRKCMHMFINKHFYKLNTSLSYPTRLEINRTVQSSVSQRRSLYGTYQGVKQRTMYRMHWITESRIRLNSQRHFRCFQSQQRMHYQCDQQPHLKSKREGAEGEVRWKQKRLCDRRLEWNERDGAKDDE